MKTLALNENWDLYLDTSGNIAVVAAENPYSQAQDAASYIRAVLGECWYNTDLGLPYFQKILGQFPPLELYRQLCIDAALQVPGVASAKVFFTSFVGRTLSGQVQITTSSGGSAIAGF